MLGMFMGSLCDLFASLALAKFTSGALPRLVIPFRLVVCMAMVGS